MTDDEIISDSWELKEIADAVYEIDCKKITPGVDQISQSIPPPHASVLYKQDRSVRKIGPLMAG